MHSTSQELGTWARHCACVGTGAGAGTGASAGTGTGADVLSGVERMCTWRALGRCTRRTMHRSGCRLHSVHIACQTSTEAFFAMHLGKRRAARAKALALAQALHLADRPSLCPRTPKCCPRGVQDAAKRLQVQLQAPMHTCKLPLLRSKTLRHHNRQSSATSWYNSSVQKQLHT